MEEADFLMFSSLEGRGGPIVRTGSGWSTVTERNAIDAEIYAIIVNGKLVVLVRETRRTSWGSGGYKYSKQRYESLTCMLIFM